jgi:hypothetical protein
MSAIWSLTGGKRTWRLCSPTSEFDPETSAICLKFHCFCPEGVFQVSSLDSYTAALEFMESTCSDARSWRL